MQVNYPDEFETPKFIEKFWDFILGEGYFAPRKQKKNYQIIIKSHGEYPDYENQITANLKKEAVEKFSNMLSNASQDYWPPEAIENDVEEIDERGNPVGAGWEHNEPIK